VRPWLPLVLLLSACPSSTPSDDDDSAVEEPTPAPRVEHWLQGTSQYTSPAGQAAPAQPTLIHRTLDPEESSLLEDVYQRNEAGGVDHFEIVGVVDPLAGTWTFSFFDGYGTFEGEGTLLGEPWAWTSWSSRSEYVDGPYVGSYVLSEDRLTDDGLEADKQIFSPDDHAEGTVAERLLFVSEGDWQAAVDAL
jgi:hypothetical protein